MEKKEGDRVHKGVHVEELHNAKASYMKKREAEKATVGFMESTGVGLEAWTQKKKGAR